MRSLATLALLLLLGSAVSAETYQVVDSTVVFDEASRSVKLSATFDKPVDFQVTVVRLHTGFTFERVTPAISWMLCDGECPGPTNNFELSNYDLRSLEDHSFGFIHFEQETPHRYAYSLPAPNVLTLEVPFADFTTYPQYGIRHGYDQHVIVSNSVSDSGQIVHSSRKGLTGLVSVPEPSSIVLASLGVVGLIVYRLCRRRLSRRDSFSLSGRTSGEPMPE